MINGNLVLDIRLLTDEKQEELGIDHEFMVYLAAMNDGNGAYKYFPGQEEDDEVLRRVAGNRRDFRFIARFLELVWPK